MDQIKYFPIAKTFVSTLKCLKQMVGCCVGSSITTTGGTFGALVLGQVGWGGDLAILTFTL